MNDQHGTQGDEGTQATGTPRTPPDAQAPLTGLAHDVTGPEDVPYGRDKRGRWLKGKRPPNRILPYTRHRLKKHEQRTMDGWIIGLKQAQYGSPEQCEHHARYCIQQTRIIRWANDSDPATNARAMTAIERAHVVLTELHALIAKAREGEPETPQTDLDRMLDD